MGNKYATCNTGIVQIISLTNFETINKTLKQIFWTKLKPTSHLENQRETEESAQAYKEAFRVNRLHLVFGFFFK